MRQSSRGACAPCSCAMHVSLYNHQLCTLRDLSGGLRERASRIIRPRIWRNARPARLRVVRGLFVSSNTNTLHPCALFGVVCVDASVRRLTSLNVTFSAERQTHRELQLRSMLSWVYAQANAPLLPGSVGDQLPHSLPGHKDPSIRLAIRGTAAGNGSNLIQSGTSNSTKAMIPLHFLFWGALVSSLLFFAIDRQSRHIFRSHWKSICLFLFY